MAKPMRALTTEAKEGMSVEGWGCAVIVLAIVPAVAPDVAVVTSHVLKLM
jgi:hypothetical protein